ncbi:hypothetical protein EDB85DRAFT_2007574 [Lactarius pseudohatsudake]|nr:hypothetical protein EDB85DRAFT_2007574 [Lactarius pseudohatsudake]
MPLPLPGHNFLTGKASLTNRGELPEMSNCFICEAEVFGEERFTKHSIYVICGSFNCRPLPHFEPIVLTNRNARIHTFRTPYVPFFTPCAHCIYQPRSPFKPIWRAAWHTVSFIIRACQQVASGLPNDDIGITASFPVTSTSLKSSKTYPHCQL